MDEHSEKYYDRNIVALRISAVLFVFGYNGEML